MTPHTVVGHLVRHAQRNPSSLAVAFGDAALTYCELCRRVLAFARSFRQAGIRPGDRIMLAAARKPEFLCSYFACHAAGAVAVPFEPDITPPRLQGSIEMVRPRAIVLHEPMPLAPRDLMVFQATACSELPFHQGDLDFVEPSPEEAADILLTSGTTNQPKGVALTHANLLAAARNINQFIGNTAEDREAVALPLSHSFGLGRVRCQIVAGAALILTHGFQFPKQLFGAMKSWRVTGLSFVPAAWTMLTRLTGDRLAEASQGLRYIEIGSAALSRSEKERLIRLFPHTRLCMHYGLTEASRSAFIEFHQSREHLDSIGRPAPNVYIRIVDEQGADVAARQIGRIQIRGDHVMQGYWKSGRCEPIAESSIYSGDLGYRDEDGYLYLCGREDDVINVGGRKVHPSEVEQALLAHQGIADAVCVATADPLTGEAIRALLVAKTASDRPSPYAIADFLTQHLEPYKIPASFEWVMAIPRNPSGKIDRRALAARTAAGTLTGIEVGVS